MANEPWKSLTDDYFEPDETDIIYDAPNKRPKLVYCWRAHHRHNQKTFVFKSIHTSQIDNLNEELKLTRFFTKLDHPHLTHVYDVIHPRGSEWIHYQMEYCEAKSLSYYLKEPLPEKRCLELIRQILEGLDYLHQNYLVHRDIKPDNIFFCKDGILKVGDYGLVKSQKWVTSLSAVGTPGYWAPEMQPDASPELHGKRNHRADLYSVGIILRQMVSGKYPPFSAQKEPPKGVRPGLWDIILKATDSEPDKRFQSARDFFAALKSYAQPPEEKLLEAIFKMPIEKSAPRKIRRSLTLEKILAPPGSQGETAPATGPVTL
ncbi:MAG: serine/threonine-protein kinase [Planctomycetota bacterium]